MPNHYFRFKQFTVYHDRCAMKVGTDGVLLGAWTDISESESILDIGTGTGLIALMLAQRNEKTIVDAIDIDKEAIEQAKENCTNSPFKDRINCFAIPLQKYSEQLEIKYDLIVSNPPFFIQSLKSPNKGRTFARHDDSLPAKELMRISSELLTNNGKLSVIYPYETKETLYSLAKENNLHITHITNVYPNPSSPPRRVLMELSKKEKHFTEDDLVIEIERHIYSERFAALAKDFYLKL